MEKAGAVFRGVDECKTRGVSVYAHRADCAKTLKLPRFRSHHVCKVALDKADNNKGDWRLVTEQGEFSGKRKEDGPSLEGLKIGRRYQFTCLEEIEESPNGREQRTLFLVEHEPA